MHPMDASPPVGAFLWVHLHGLIPRSAFPGAYSCECTLPDVLLWAYSCGCIAGGALSRAFFLLLGQYSGGIFRLLRHALEGLFSAFIKKAESKTPSAFSCMLGRG